MLTLQQYFGKWLKCDDATDRRKDNAEVLVVRVNKLVAVMEQGGVSFKVNPLTGSIVGGETLGGFRPQACPIGAPQSAHKEGLAVDIYDPDNKIDAWITSHAKELAQYGLYFEHPTATPRWSHWTIRAPKSGRRFFYP